MSIHQELESAWKRANSHGGVVKLVSPGLLEPAESANTLIRLLKSAYTNHAISKDPDKVEFDIKHNNVRPWFVTRNDIPVACTALIRQDDGSTELGRAVSIEKGTGVGKIAMLSAAMNNGSSKLVAEVRLAADFEGITGSEATQRICLGILNLVPHALMFAFKHGERPRREMFGFSAENTKLIDHSPIKTAENVMLSRSSVGTVSRLRVIQTEPFRVAVADEAGCNYDEFIKDNRCKGAGFTLLPIEATDHNLSTIHTLLNNDFELVGLDRNLGSSGLPVLLLATVSLGETLAPSNPSSVLHNNLRMDITNIDRKFRKLAGAN